MQWWSFIGFVLMTLGSAWISFCFFLARDEEIMRLRKLEDLDKWLALLREAIRETIENVRMVNDRLRQGLINQGVLSPGSTDEAYDVERETKNTRERLEALQAEVDALENPGVKAGELARLHIKHGVGFFVFALGALCALVPHVVSLFGG